MSWGDVSGSEAQQGVYVLVYARLGYRGVGIGDGSEATPYRRDEASVALAQKAFRGLVVGNGRGEKAIVGAEKATVAARRAAARALEAQGLELWRARLSEGRVLAGSA